MARGKAHRAEATGPANKLMLDLANLRSGHRVLDVAAGTGDQTLMAARRVGPGGYVLATDISASMLQLAAEAAQGAGLTNVETRVMDAENLDLEPDSFDAVICRMGLMLMPNPVKRAHRNAPRREAFGKSCRCCFVRGRKKSILGDSACGGSPLGNNHLANAGSPRAFALAATKACSKISTGKPAFTT